MQVEYLLLGLPGERPGGLFLTILYAITSGFIAFLLGLLYVVIEDKCSRISILLQTGVATLRGVPVILLIFLLANTSGLSPSFSGLIALSLYSFSHVSEVLRAHFSCYPKELKEQSEVMGIHPIRDLLSLRIPWTIEKAWGALGTHWVSLLKDTGALVIISVGELTTVAKSLSESSSELTEWLMILSSTAVLYLFATLILVYLVRIAEVKLLINERERNKIAEY